MPDGGAHPAPGACIHLSPGPRCGQTTPGGAHLAPAFTPTNDDGAALTHEQVRAHVALVGAGVTGGVAVALFLAFVQWDVIDHRAILLWLACLAPVYVYRVWLARSHRVLAARCTDASWRTRFRVSFALHGAVWGLTSWLLFPAGDVPHQSFLTLTLAGAGASAVTLTAFDLTAGLLFMGLAMAPLAVRLALEGGHVHTTMGVLVALFMAYMTINARRAHLAVAEGVGLRRAATARAEFLTRFEAVLTKMRVHRASTDVFFAEAVADTATVLGLSRAVLWLCDGEPGPGQVARAQAVAGPRTGRIDDLGTLTLANHPRYAARLASGGTLVRDAARDEPALLDLAGTAHLPTEVQARLDVPLSIGGRLGGLLWCEHDRAHRWTAHEEAFVTAVASTLLTTIEEGRRQRAEQQLRDLNQNLERLVHERTRALGASEARLAQALEVTNDGLWELDRASGAMYFSPVWTQLLGYAHDEVPPRVEFLVQALHPDDRTAVQATIADHFAGRVPIVEREVRLRTKGGEYRWFLGKGRVVARAADGTPLRMVGTISDITERTRALENLRDSEERFRAVFDKSPVTVTLVRLADNRIAEVNEAGLRAFGYSRDEMIGRTGAALNLLFDEGDRARTMAMVSAQNHVTGLEVHLRRKNGEGFWALVNTNLITFDGEPYRLNTLQDITERRELEARFLQSQKMEVVGHLAGGIAHDFNNVLTVITGTAELAMASAGDDDPMHEALATIRDASARAARLTGQLMAFSRRQILQPVSLDLNDVVTGLESMLRRAAGATVALEITPAPEPATVVADRGSVEQVILNLAINARDAMPAGGTLRIAVSRVAVANGASAPGDLRPGTYATLTISDTGSGMSAAVVQRIFEPFFTTKAVGKGTGLGLSMAHGVVAQSGGDIQVQSVVGTGSTFTIYLPWTTHSAAPSLPPPNRLAAGHETILVVDDNREIREVVRRVLAFTGYQVLTAEHGEDALRVLREHAGQVDLLLTDVVMPGLNGSELARRVAVSYPALKVLFTSGYADDAIARHGVLAHGVEFIAKPYSLQALATKVRDVLDGPSGPPAS